MLKVIGVVVFLIGIAGAAAEVTGLSSLVPSLAGKASPLVYAGIAAIGVAIYMFFRSPSD